MWKCILLCVLIVVQSTEIEKIFGAWTNIACYPSHANEHVCMEYMFNKDSSDLECTCADGKIPTFVEYSILEKDGNETINVVIDTFPMLVINKTEKVSLKVPCTCAETNYTARAVARLLKPNYFVMYDMYSVEERECIEAYPNGAYLFAKEIPKLTALEATLESIEEVKNRNGAACVF